MPGSTSSGSGRCVTVLRAVGTPEAKELLAKIEAAVR